MHDPRVGRFFAVDPLAPKYPHNSPYAFSENDVISHVELEGLEKGNLKILNSEKRIAKIEWQKIYFAVTDGNKAVHNLGQVKLQDQEFIDNFLKPYKKGANIIYINRLPVIKNNDGSLTRQTVKLLTEKEYNDGKAWKLVVDFNIKLEVSEYCFSETDIRKKMSTDMQSRYLYGILLPESAAPQKLDNGTVALGVVGDYPFKMDEVYLSDEVFGPRPKVVKDAGITDGELVSHEAAHNFGLHHEKGDYSQTGLMSNKSALINATKENQVEIINHNLDAITPTQ
ncbi:hypothetical protein VF12_39790 [Nostoc linckia z15]|nr:hypothetical protein VF12_39790 [Nostoc linckia z15]